MSLRLEFSVNVMRLYNGRRSFYAQCTVGRRRFWIMRWDTARAPRNRFKTGCDACSMGWTWGVAR